MTAVAKTSNGFVLPLVLWVLAAIAIGVAIFAERVAAALDLASASQQRVQRIIDMSETRAEILFRLGTTPLSEYGLGTLPGPVIALADQPYRGEGRSVVSLQDERGLFNFNSASEDQVHRFLGAFDVPFDERGHLIDTLRDYTDEDDFKRLNGAESREYAAGGLPPPPNRDLLTPFDARRILGWNGLLGKWRQVDELSATGDSVGINPNTAVWQVIATVPGVSGEAARLFLDRRAAQPIQSIEQIGSIVAVPMNSLFLKVFPFPGDNIRITQFIQGEARAWRYSVKLTPDDENAPWRISYQTTIELSDERSNAKVVPALPERVKPPQNTSTPVFPF